MRSRGTPPTKYWLHCCCCENLSSLLRCIAENRQHVYVLTVTALLLSRVMHGSRELIRCLLLTAVDAVKSIDQSRRTACARTPSLLCLLQHRQPATLSRQGKGQHKTGFTHVFPYRRVVYPHGKEVVRSRRSMIGRPSRSPPRPCSR